MHPLALLYSTFSLDWLIKWWKQDLGPSADSISGAPSSDPHDPHDLPTFDSASLIHPKAPIFHLPPLLSSLPHSLPPLPLPELPENYRPIVTKTHLPDIDPASLSLHKALHHFRPVSVNYATLSYENAFNWFELVLPEHEEREWYCVVFRSKRKPGSDSGALYEADRIAHEEAVRNGGLLLYWYGVPDPETGLNLATCIWQSRNHAISASSRPHHAVAMTLAAASYDIYALERHILRKQIGSVGVTVAPYVFGEVGW